MAIVTNNPRRSQDDPTSFGLPPAGNDYNMLRYVIWLIPTLGLVGTVLGIAFGMRTAGVMSAGASITEATLGPEMMEQLTGDLGVASYTTLLAHKERSPARE